MITPDDLVQLELIKRLKYRYLRCIDQKRFDELEACFTGDATASYGGGAHRFEGRDAIMAFLRTSMASTEMLTSHRCHHPEIDLNTEGDGDRATGVWALEDVVVLVDLGLTVRGAAFYTDRYRRVYGQWLIAHTGYQRTYEELAPRPADTQLTASWWGTGGRSQLPAG